MATLRVKVGTNCVVFLPDGTTVALLANQPWDSSDPFVRAHPEYFEADGQSQPIPKRAVSNLQKSCEIRRNMRAKRLKRDFRL